MAKWTGVITNAGNSLLNAWVGEKTLRFDCAKAGTGTVEIAALMAQTDLVSQKQDAAILNAESVDGGIRMKLRVTASQEGYLLNQFGVWASVDGKTALIAIYQHEQGVSVPGIDESPDFAFTFYALIMTSNTGTWTVNIDTSALVTLDDMNSSIAESAKKYLPLSGGKMAGNIDMQGKAISGLNEPTEGTQAVPKSYVDKRVPLDGSVPMTGNLSMGAHRITGLAEPDDDGDAATKGYADTKAALPKTDSGTVIALSDASDGSLQGLRIYGRTTQDGTPTPDAPVELVSVGDGGSVEAMVLGAQLADNRISEVVGDPVYSIDGNYATYKNTSGYQCRVVLKKRSLPAGTYTAYIRDIITNEGLVGIGINGSTVRWLNKSELRYVFTLEDKANVFITLTTPNLTNIGDFSCYFGIVAGDVQLTDCPKIDAVPDAQSMTLSTPNGLPGIPVTSGGNYTDADGQQWVCNEVDLARGVYVQRIQSVTLTGSETWTQITNVTGVFQAPVLGGVYIPGYVAVPTNIMCNYYQPIPRKALIEKTEPGVGIYTKKTLIIYDESLSTTTLLKNKLAELYDAGNPVKVLAILETPVETPIPEDELAAYAALHTNRPNTTVYNDAGAHMEVGYYPPDATMRQEDIMGALDHVGNAAKEYVDAKHFLATVSLPAASWTGDAAPYTQTVPVSGILATDFPHVTPVYSSTLATALAQKEAWSMVNMGVPGAGEITFTCFEDKPTVAIPIQIEVMR